MRVWVLLMLVAAVPATTSAQFDSGQISGFVRDAQQAAIPGATVTVTNQGNGDHRSTVTNAAGFYVFPDVPVGIYSVTVELSGFKKFVQTDVRLSAASQMAVDGVLEVGSLEETVEVRASPSQVQTTTAQVARTIDTRQIQALTLNGRNPIYLASLKPGVRGGTIEFSRRRTSERWTACRNAVCPGSCSAIAPSTQTTTRPIRAPATTPANESASRRK